MMRKIKLTRANKGILLKALAPYYYQERELWHSKTPHLLDSISYCLTNGVQFRIEGLLSIKFLCVTLPHMSIYLSLQADFES